MNDQPFKNADVGKEKAAFVRLVHRARMINHIHDALQSTLNPETLYRIIAAMLISHRGMGFSRAMLFQYEPVEDRFHACAAYGSFTRADHERILSELDGDEEDAERPAETDDLELDWVNEENLFQPMIDERNHPAFWGKIAEKYEKSNPLFEKIRHVGFGSREQQKESSDGAPAADRGLIAKILKGKTCALVSPEQVQRSALPSELKEVLSVDWSLWAAIRTRKRARLIVIVDKMFEDRDEETGAAPQSATPPIDEIDQLHLDWFCGLVTTTLEKARLFSELQRTNESLKVMDTLKSNFLSTVSHELRSPLTAITGFTRLLVGQQVGEITERQREMLDRVLHNGEKLTNIINDLIEIAEIDSGITTNVALGAVDPLNVLMTLRPKLEPRLASKSAEIVPLVGDGVPLIRADEKRLGRIFYHLIDNAIKFGKTHGKVMIEFLKEDGKLAIKIIDSGIGIAPEKLDRIFESFYQVDNQMARVYEGMGIGLTLTSRLVAGTGGELKVESRIGEGTTFIIIYPLAQG